MPSPQLFGWLYAIAEISEMDVLNMVGLDAYMFLRYHVVCYKLAIFMSIWGVFVLMPLYGTASDMNHGWNKYTISNVLGGSELEKFRLWVPALLSYIFAAYFCQLLHAEYHNFAIRRLQFLVQADPESSTADPDTPQQAYYTVMVERIPPQLRSADALNKFFEKLFPGEVYHVEVALDLSQLNALDAERREVCLYIIVLLYCSNYACVCLV